MTVNQVHDLPWYGQFWYQPKGISNILGLSNVADNDKYLVRYDSQESKNFIITRTKGGKENRFCRASRGLQWIDAKSTKTGEDGEVLINTVEANNFSFTRRSYLRAKLARKIQHIIGRPSVKALKLIICRNLLTNCPVSIVDVSDAEDTFLPAEVRLHGKTGRTKIQEVRSQFTNLPMELITNISQLFIH